ncbi:MAG: Ribosomal large subunit pseudouridine synthase [Pseudomonadota bacterium]
MVLHPLKLVTITATRPRHRSPPVKLRAQVLARMVRALSLRPISRRALQKNAVMSSIIAKALDSQAFDHSDPGAGASHDLLEVDAASGAGERVDRFLARQLPRYSRTRIQRWIDQGAVRWDEQVLSCSYRLTGAETIQVEPQPIEADHAFGPEAVPLSIIHQDDALIVLDKAPGLVVHPAAGNWHGTVLNGLLHHDAKLASLPRAGIVHRLDKDTSGLMVVARTEASMLRLGQQLADRSMGRRYFALVQGAAPMTGSAEAPIGRDPVLRTRMAVVDPPRGKHARTDFRCLASTSGVFGTVSLLECRLHTGRTHQIRVHLQHLGFPLVGDPVYGRRSDLPLARQALHAWQLSLRHPEDGREQTWRADLPEDFQRLLHQVGIELEAVKAAAQRPFQPAKASS